MRDGRCCLNVAKRKECRTARPDAGGVRPNILLLTQFFMNYNKTAEILDQAAATAEPIEQISKQEKMNLEEAYAVQSISMMRRYLRGEKRVGLKLGFTSKAKMEQMGVHDMIWGRLTDKMQYESGAELRKSDFIHPRAEPEIAFVVSKKIDTKITLENAVDYVESVAVAIEIIDSRYQNFKFSLEDVVADNCSSTGFVVGKAFSTATKIQDVDITLSVDGKVVHEGNSNAILGNPWESFVAAARLAQENGEILDKGAIVLAGAATPAVYIEVGQIVTVTATGLGEVGLTVV